MGFGVKGPRIGPKGSGIMSIGHMLANESRHRQGEDRKAIEAEFKYRKEHPLSEEEQEAVRVYSEQWQAEQDAKKKAAIDYELAHPYKTAGEQAILTPLVVILVGVFLLGGGWLCVCPIALLSAPAAAIYYLAQRAKYNK